MSNATYIQYGCGWETAQDWVSFDSSPTLRLERVPIIGQLYNPNKQRFPIDVKYGDIIKGLPLKDGTCKGIYCSHVLEHLSLEDFRVALQNTHKLLAKDGVFRLVVPDLEYMTKEYIEDPSHNAAITFMSESYLGRHHRNKGLKGLIKNHFGNSHHLWMWDYKSLYSELKNTGFTQVRRATYGDSKDPNFKSVEKKDRWLNCLSIECKR